MKNLPVTVRAAALASASMLPGIAAAKLAGNHNQTLLHGWRLRIPSRHAAAHACAAPGRASAERVIAGTIAHAPHPRARPARESSLAPPGATR